MCCELSVSTYLSKWVRYVLQDAETIESTWGAYQCVVRCTTANNKGAPSPMRDAASVCIETGQLF